MLFSRSKSVVGLDIGSSAVKLIELKEKKAGSFIFFGSVWRRCPRRPSSTAPSWTRPWWWMPSTSSTTTPR